MDLGLGGHDERDRPGAARVPSKGDYVLCAPQGSAKTLYVRARGGIYGIFCIRAWIGSSMNDALAPPSVTCSFGGRPCGTCAK
jgi:hypothetical protein